MSLSPPPQQNEFNWIWQKWLYDVWVNLTGKVDTTGTPANDQVAVFTDEDTIEGSSSLTWDGTTLGVTGDVSSTGLDVTSSTDKGIDLTFTDSTADAEFSGMFIDYNSSGADTVTVDRIHAGIRIDADASATGGDITNEHLLYGAYFDVRASEDSNRVYGIQALARAQHSSGTITQVFGAQFYSDFAGSGTADMGSVYGSNSEGRAEATSSDSVILYGAQNRARVLDGNTSTVDAMTGTYSYVLIDEPAGSASAVTAAYASRALITNNGVTTPVTLTNAFLFYGSYGTDTNITNKYGVYISDTDAINYFGGPVNVDGLATFAGDVKADGYIQSNTATDTELNDIAHAINTNAGKIQGAMVYNTTQDKPVWAVGSADGSVWVDGAGTTANTPVV